jgi:hypothetical protein
VSGRPWSPDGRGWAEAPAVEGTLLDPGGVWFASMGPGPWAHAPGRLTPSRAGLRAKVTDLLWGLSDLLFPLLSRRLRRRRHRATLRRRREARARLAASRGKRSLLHPLARGIGLCAGLALMGLACAAVDARDLRSPTEVRALTHREVTIRLLGPGESVLATLDVTHRSPLDYFRKSYGSVFLTSSRLLVVSVPPKPVGLVRELVQAQPFEVDVYVVDTLLQVAVRPARSGALATWWAQRTVGSGSTADVTVQPGDSAAGDAPPRTLRLNGGTSSTATTWLAALAAVQASERAAAVAARHVAAERTREAAMPVYYVVQPGDALVRIALAAHVPVDSLRLWNGIETTVITAGQSLLLKRGAGVR